MIAVKKRIGLLGQLFLTAVFGALAVQTASALTGQTADYSSAELEELVGPVALYPDDLIAIILPASSYPLQIVEAARYLEEVKTNPDLKVDDDWDDAVVALLNYPEVITLLNEDLDWTWNLGEAVVNQQAAVLDAIQDFRGRAVTAGNLETDDRQTVSQVDDVIEITPVESEVIYVPYYEPERVVVYQPRPVYHYYPSAYPVYYYPYPDRYEFTSGFFWGVTTAYTIGWLTDRVHYHYYGQASHPYYGRHYNSNYYARRSGWNRRHNYAGPRSRFVYNRHHYGNTWKPRHRHGDRPGHYRDDDRGHDRRHDRDHNRRHNRADEHRHEGIASNFNRSTRHQGRSGDRHRRANGKSITRSGFRAGRPREHLHRENTNRETKRIVDTRRAHTHRADTRRANTNRENQRSQDTHFNKHQRSIGSTRKNTRLASLGRSDGNRIVAERNKHPVRQSRPAARNSRDQNSVREHRATPRSASKPRAHAKSGTASPRRAEKVARVARNNRSSGERGRPHAGRSGKR